MRTTLWIFLFVMSRGCNCNCGGAADSSLQIYGINGNALYAKQKLSDEQFLTAIYNLKSPSLRAPGGVCNEFNWRTGRKVGDSSGKSMTVPEIALLLKNSPGPDVLSINLWDTKESQLEWLDSLNASGVHVDNCIIEMGNELTNGDNPGRVRFNNSGAAYGDTCKIWASFLRQKYPNIKIACWSENKPEIKDWVEGLYTHFTPDYGVNHLYPKYVNIGNGNGEVDYPALAFWIEHSFDNGGWDKKRPLLITEFNISPQDFTEWKPGEAEKALQFMYQTFARYPAIKGVWMHNISGDLGVLSDSLTLQESGKVFEWWMAQKLHK